MSPTRSLRTAGLTGLTSFALIILATFVAPPLWESPGTTATAQDVADFAFPHRGRILAGLFIYVISMGFFLWFAAALWSWFRLWEKEEQVLSATFAFGAVSLVTLILAAFAPASLAVYHPPDPDVAALLFELNFAVLALSGLPTAVCLGAYAALVLRGAPLPRWTALVAVVGALSHVVIIGSFFPKSGPFSLEGAVIVWVPATFFAWILAVGVACLRAAPRPEGQAGLAAGTP